MASYGHELLFGTFLTPAATSVQRVVALAELTEQVGLDLVTLQDHPYQAAHADTWTLLSVIAARTSRVRVSPNVANLPLRPPAVLARAAATLDLATDGRVELGLGAGAFWDGIAALGGARLSPAESVDALEEAIQVIRAMWDTDSRSVRVEGRYHRVVGAHPGPAPAHDIGIWLGAYKRRMLALTGRRADGWLPSSQYATPDQLPAMNRAIDAGAEEAGRDPAAIRRLYNISGRFDGRGGGFLQGSPAVWVEQLTTLVLEQGMSGFVLVSDDPDTIRRYAAEVAPGVREAVTPSYDGQGETPFETVTVAHPAAPNGLGFQTTPDDGARLVPDARVWDEASRPAGPRPDPERTYTDHQKAGGHHLVEVHDHLRAELEQLRGLVEQVVAGQLGAGAARSHINTMTMRQNNWTLGTYCESYCRVVTTHHSLEDAALFPHLRSADPQLAPVVDRLAEEHLVIHDLLERVDQALVALVSGERDGLRRLQHAVDVLTDSLRSHLSYEERELVEPIARLGAY